MRNTFRVYERLKREQHIKTLFQKGKAFSVFPVRALVLSTERGSEQSSVRAGFSAPKKKLRQSVERQRVKRLLREAWRLQKSRLYEAIPEDVQLHIFFLYLQKEIAPYEVVSQSINAIVDQLILQHQKTEA